MKLEKGNSFDKSWKIKKCEICKNNHIYFFERVCHTCKVIALTQLIK